MNLHQNMLAFQIQKIIIKQGFDPTTFNNDIALVQLFYPVPAYLSPICLTNAAPETNSTAIVTGWGATADGKQYYFLICSVTDLKK